MRVILGLPLVFLIGCMTGSLVDSTLPQTGNHGVVKAEYVDGTPSEQSQNAYKRQLTRGYYSSTDTIRVLFITNPYLKVVSEDWARKDGKKNSSTPAQIAEASRYMFEKNQKDLTLNKTCFDMELNSNEEAAGGNQSWSGTLTEIDSGKEVSLVFKFSNSYIQRDRGGWFQFTAVVCASEPLNPHNSFRMKLEPKYRENKIIQLSWSYKK